MSNQTAESEQQVKITPQNPAVQEKIKRENSPVVRRSTRKVVPPSRLVVSHGSKRYGEMTDVLTEGSLSEDESSSPSLLKDESSCSSSGSDSGSSDRDD